MLKLNFHEACGFTCSYRKNAKFSLNVHKMLNGNIFAALN